MVTNVLQTRRRAERRPRPRRAKRRPDIEPLEARFLLSFQVLGTLGTTVSLPTGTAFRINDFEPDAMNNRGDIVYGDDLGTANDPSTFFGEGVFLRSGGRETLLGSSTAPAPGGGTFDFGFEGPATLNDQGDAAVDFLLQPAGSPFGVNAGAFRYSHNTQAVTAVVLPGVTPAPAGGTFAGVSFGPSLDNRGDLYFVGIIPTDQGVHVPGQPYGGLGMGVFEADRAGHIISIVSPGDPAPGGGTFDDAGETYSCGAWVNGRGDVAFVGHVAGEEAQVPGFPPQSAFIATLGSLYVKSGATGQITSIAHAGDLAPGGGVFRQALFPGINDRGDVVFTGDLTPAPGANQALGVFLYSGGNLSAIARPGDLMPGGGHFVTASVINGQTHINNRGDVVFNAALDTTHNGIPDTGLFEWSHGRLSLIARSGTVLPGVGTVDNLDFNVIVTPPPPILVPNSGAVNNNRGQVFFGATLTDGRAVMLLDTPDDSGGGGGGDNAPVPGPGGATGSGGRGSGPTEALLAVLAPVGRGLAPPAGHGVWATRALPGPADPGPVSPPVWSLDGPQRIEPVPAGAPHTPAFDRFFADLGNRLPDDPFFDGASFR
jgi:hypothetical protein